jgi:hypothetical protein
MSGNHFARDCSHYGAWEAMRDTNMLEATVSFEDKEVDQVEYLAIVAEHLNTTESEYLCETPNSYAYREVHIVAGSKVIMKSMYYTSFSGHLWPM